MKKRMIGLLVAGLVVCCVVGLASGADVAASAKLGTLGLGADAAMALNDQFNCRVGLNYLPAFDISSFVDTGDEAGDVIQDLSIELEGLTVGAFADWHPAAGKFRVTAGLLLNSIEADITGTPNYTVTVAGRQYRATDASGDVTFASVSPYIGIGVGNPFKGEGQWFFTMDAGVMFHGTPELDLRATASDPAAQAILDAEVEKQEQDAQDSIDAISVWPVLSAGVTYKF